jgi:hypothetical protein
MIIEHVFDLFGPSALTYTWDSIFADADEMLAFFVFDMPEILSKSLPLVNAKCRTVFAVNHKLATLVTHRNSTFRADRPGTAGDPGPRLPLAFPLRLTLITLQKPIYAPLP